MIKMYGIPNCDQIKKTRKFLADVGLEFEEINYKLIPPGRELVESCIRARGHEVVVNRRSTTWRNLEPSRKEVEGEQLIELLLEQPTLLKRPLIETDGDYVIGFAEVQKKFGED